MKDKYGDIINLIKESFDNQIFDLNIFQFYETRREKNKYSTGIVNYNNNKYYFKLVDSSSYIEDEKVILDIIKPDFTIIEKLESFKNNKGEIIDLYKYIPATKINEKEL